MEPQEGKYTSIKAAVANPKDVRILELQNQGIQWVPEEIFSFPNLHTLNLKDNLLSDLPLEFVNLPITHLHLGGNRFANFPLILGNMRKLEELDLSNNTFREFPNELSYLADKLTYLNVKDSLINEREELKCIRFLPKTHITFSLVKSYDPDRPEDRNWTHINDKKPFNWVRFLSWMAVPVGLILLSLGLRVVYNQIGPDPYAPEPRIEVEGINR